MAFESTCNLLIVSFPSQGHVNPLLRLAKHLASKGLSITFSTTQNIGQKIPNIAYEPTPIGEGMLRFELFSDGLADDEVTKRHDMEGWMRQLETVGRDSFTQLIKNQSKSRRPVSCIISSPFTPWVTDVAFDMGIPSAVLWAESCAVYSTYYHYFHNLASFPTVDHPDLSVCIPGLPVLESDEITSLLHPFCPPVGQALNKAILSQFKNLSKSFCVFINSFDELEHDALRALSSFSPAIKQIGPLFMYPKEENTNVKFATPVRDNCLEWLDCQPSASVVYVAFGSIVAIGSDHMAEIAKGLLYSGEKFLWVVRKQTEEEIEWNLGKLPVGFMTEMEGQGLVVPWCPQDRVLAHPSVACFITHCGWNSTMESLSFGVPVVAFPQWGDQVTNAKFLVDVFRVGVRLSRSRADLQTLTSEEVKRCLAEVMHGLKAEEIKKNAFKWKKAAEEAVEGGSSDQNIQEFVGEVIRGLEKMV